MNRKFIWFVTPLLLACLHLAEAQQPKTHRIGFLGGSSASAYSAFLEAFQLAMRGLGYAEGTDYVLDYQLGDGRLDRLPVLAAELVRSEVGVVLVSGARATSEIKTATKSIPVVMTTIEDPVAMGIVQSLARPGGNITGLTNLAPELSGKRLELLKEILPKISRVAVLWPPNAAGAVVTFKESQQVAPALGIEIQSLEVRSPQDFDRAFNTASRKAGAILVLQSALTNAHRKPIAELAIKNRVPTVFTQKEYIEAGGLISYGVDTTDLYRRAAFFVDKS